MKTSSLQYYFKVTEDEKKLHRQKTTRDKWMRTSSWHGGKRRLSTKKQQKSQSDTLNTAYVGKKITCTLNKNTNETWPKSSSIAIISLLRTGQTGKSSSTKGRMTRNYPRSLYSLHRKGNPGGWTLPLFFELLLEAKYFPCLHSSNK